MDHRGSGIRTWGRPVMRQATALVLLVAAALSLVLFGMKYQVRDLEGELTGIDRAILAERRSLHVLRAEWSHLNDPARLGALAERHLGLMPVAPTQLATFADLAPREAELGGAKSEDAEVLEARLTRTGESR
jgi:cell division protein FtsL